MALRTHSDETPNSTSLSTPYPVSWGQQLLWDIHRFNPDTYAYNVPFAFVLQPRTQLDKLEQALSALVRQHPVLTTTFHKQKEGVYQRLNPAQTVTVTKLAYSVTAGSTAENDALTKLATQPFDLEHGPLYRFYFITRPNEETLLFSNIHHLVFDGISTQTLLSQLNELYTVLVRGEKEEMSVDADRYRQFVAWQADYLQTPQAAESQAFWTDLLQSPLDPLALPYDRAPGTSPNAEGASLNHPLEALLLPEVSAYCSEQELSPFALMLGVYGLLLQKYSQQDQFFVGIPMSGRPEARFETAMGLFMNVVPIPFNFDEATTAQAFLQQVQTRVYDVFEHSYFPVEKIIREQKLKRPFKTAFYFQNWMDASFGDGLAKTLLPDIRQSGEFDLAMEVSLMGEQWLLSLKYNPTLFDASTIALMAAHYQALLTAVIRQPKQTLKNSSHYSATDARYYDILNDTFGEGETRETFLDLFASQVQRRPLAVAVMVGDEPLTYDQLNTLSDQVAVQLIEQYGVQPEEIVGVYLDRTMAMLVTLLAIQKTGATYLPFDITFPADRINYMVEDAGLTKCIVSQQTGTTFTAPQVVSISIDDLLGQVTAKRVDPDQLAVRRPAGQDRVYVLYTSGSTGKPKGVEVLHRGLSNFLLAMAKTPGMTERERCLAITTVSFDIAGLELYLPLVTGATVEIVPSEILKDGRRLLEHIVRTRPSVVQATPSTWQMLINAGWNTPLPIRAFCGGEALPAELAEKLLSQAGEVWNLFGPTETTIWSTVAPIGLREKITIGQPIRNTSVYLLDAAMQPVPVGQAGDMYIGGEGLARGYLNRPELTQERFLNWQSNGQTIPIYKTGDLARLLPSGNLDYIGRSDLQAKIRGYRIEIQEIENTLLRADGLANAAVVIRDGKLGKQLVAFITMKPQAHYKPETVTAFLGQWLPPYMVPSSVHVLTDFPYTLNNKIDRSVLTKQPMEEILTQFATATASTEATSPPETLLTTPASVPAALTPDEALHHVLTVVGRLLNEDPASIKPTDKFGSLGFDSISFTTLSEQLLDAVGQDVRPNLFYQYDTPATLANYLAQAGKKPVSAACVSPGTQTRPQSMAPVADDEYANAIAVTGISLRFPGADQITTFWKNLREGQDLVTEIPTDRWDWQAFQGQTKETNKSTTKWGGFIRDIDKFDAGFFGISPREAALMDPQQRILLEAVWATVEDAGYKMSALSNSRTGLFVGMSGSDFFEQLIRSNLPIDPYTLTGVARSILPNRISYLFNLTGPSEPIDTACSSSMVAIHRAVSSILQGDCDLALAAGINLLISPSAHVASSKMGMMSKQGRCRAFDADADGYVRGEGCGVVLLKPYRKALADGDHIYALVRSTSLNHGGKSNSLTAPNANAQGNLIQAALQKAHINPATISYVETHGTGTSLGDPIEVEGLKLAFERVNEQQGGRPLPTGYCGLGSVKTNIGHLEAAAGIAGFIKTVLALHQAELPPLVHFSAKNPNIIVEDSPFYLATQRQAWTRLRQDGQEVPRRAGVSSFGFGGVNAHALLEEAPSVDQVISVDQDPQILLLSAKSINRLKAQAQPLLDCLQQSPSSVSLSALAFTLMEGREAMAHRWAAVVRTLAEAQQALQTLLTAESEVNNVYTVSLADQPVDNRLQAMAEQWVNHTLELTWAAVWPEKAESQPRRLSLPAYPFEKQSHWPFTPEVTRRIHGQLLADEPPVPSVTEKPLFDREETSGVARYFYKSLQTEHFLADHIIRQEPVLPGVFYLELMRSAFASVSSEPFIISDLVWLQPIVQREAALEIQVSLQPTSTGTYDCRVTTAKPDQSRLTHAVGKIKRPTADELNEPAEPLTPQFRERFTKGLTREECYEQFRANQFFYGESLNVIEQVFFGAQEAVAVLNANPTFSRQDFGSNINTVWLPSILDGGLQTVALWLSTLAAREGRFLPFSIDEVRVVRPFSHHSYVQILAVPSHDAKSIKCTLYFYDERFELVACLKNYCLKAIPPAKLPASVTEAVAEETGVGDLLYAVPQWTATPPLATGLYQPTTVLVVSDELPFVAALQTSILSSTVPSSTIFSVTATRPFTLPENLPAILTDVVIDTKALRGSTQETITAVLAIHRTLLDRFGKQPLNLYYLCRESQAMLAEETISAALFTSLGAFVRSLHLENPNWQARLIQVASATDVQTLADLVRHEWHQPPTQIAEIRYESTNRYLKTYVPLEQLSPAFEPPVLRQKGVYLIVGGARGVGRIMAQYLSRTYQAHLILVGKSALSPAIAQTLAGLTQAGGTAEYYSVDVAQREALRECLAEVRAQHPRINGILYGAGILNDSYFGRKTDASFLSVLAPKVQGLYHMDELTADWPLEFLLAFSSTSAVFGNVGQTDYAWANAFMDDYLDRRQQLAGQGLRQGRSLSVNWGFWQEGTMQMPAAVRQKLAHQFGLHPIDSPRGLAAFEAVLAGAAPQVVVMQGEREKLMQTLMQLNPVESYVTTPVQPLSVFSNETSPVPMTSPTLIPYELAQPFFRELIAQATKLPISQVRPDEAFDQYGIDSVMILTLNEELEGHFGELPKTLFFEFQNVRELTSYFVDNHVDRLRTLLKMDVSAPVPMPAPVAPPTSMAAPVLPVAAPQPIAQPQAVTPAPAAPDEEIAIIGISGRYPMADTLLDFWENLRKGQDCISEIPEDRWDVDAFYDETHSEGGKSYSKWGGFLNDVDKFDPLFFNISPFEAELLDPQERLFLQTVWHTLEDAGMTRESLNRAKVGVFAGVMWGHYQLYGGDTYADGATLTPMSSYASIANRVSYFYNFTGPSIALDTMCSSSLTTVHLACESLKRGECELAVAGGVNVSVHPNKYIFLSQTKFISTDGKCHSFGEGGDGYVPGEGVGAVLLKPLRNAIADKDRIYGVIKASGINHGGKANGYTVPSPKAQTAIIRDVLDKAAIDPRSISYVEAHGTGTALGDPIEISGLTTAFRGAAKAGQFCAIGSVKSNIGHCESAAGIAALTKVVLQLKHRQLVPSLHSSVLNPNINFTQTPFVVQQQLAPWERPRFEQNGQLTEAPLRACISSFGAGGANAHLIVEEYDAPDRRIDASVGPQLFILSARTEERLKAYARTIEQFLGEPVPGATNPAADASTTPSLGQLSRTIQTLCAQVINIGQPHVDAEEAFVADLGMSVRELHQLLAEINTTYGIDLSMNDVHENATPSQLAAYLIDRYPTIPRSVSDTEPAGEAVCRYESLNWSDFIYTYQVGREDMDYRLAIMATDFSDLITHLRAYQTGEWTPEKLVSGRVGKDKDTTRLLLDDEDGNQYIDTLIARQKLDKLALLWVSGIRVDWKRLHQYQPQALSAPGYPFAKERCWLPEHPKVNVAAIQFLHPLLDKINVSLSLSEGIVLEKTFDRSSKYSTKLETGFTIQQDVLVEMALAAARQVYSAQAIALTHWKAEEPVMAPGKALTLNLQIKPQTDETALIDVFVYQNGQKITFATGQARAIPTQDGQPGGFNLADLQKTHSVTLADGILTNETASSFLFPLPVSKRFGKEYAQLSNLPTTFARLRQRIVPRLYDQPQADWMGVERIHAYQFLDGDAWAYAEQTSDGRLTVNLLRSDGALISRYEQVSYDRNHQALDRFFYLPHWEVTPLPAEAAVEETGRKLIVYTSANASVARHIVAAFPTTEVYSLELGHETKRIADQVYEIDYRDQTALATLCAQWTDVETIYFMAGSESGAFDAVNASAFAELQEASLISLYRLMKTVLGGETQRAISLKVLTHNTYKVTGQEALSPWSAGVIGLARTFAKEYPRSKVVCMDLDFTAFAAESVGSGESLVSVIRQEPAAKQGRQVALRGQERFERTLLPVKFPGSESTSLLRSNGVYLVFGGAGNVGFKVGKYLADQYQATVVIIGRSALTPELQQKVDALTQLGGRGQYVSADMANAENLTQVVDQLYAQHGTIHGVFHSALHFQYDLINDTDETRLRANLSAKLDGSYTIGTVFADRPLDFMVYFSSGEAFTGNPGWGSYAAGCTFSDAYATALNQHTAYPVKILNWGFWQGNEGDFDSLLQQKGITPIDEQLGMEALRVFLTEPVEQVLGLNVADRVIERMGADLSREVVYPLQTPLQIRSRRVAAGSVPQPVVRAVSAQPSAPMAALPVSSAAQSPEEQKATIRTYAKGVFARLLKANAAQMEDDVEFTNYGVDSLIVTDIHKEFETNLGKLSVTLLLENSTFDKLTQYLYMNHLDAVVHFLGQSGEKPVNNTADVVTAATSVAPAVQAIVAGIPLTTEPVHQVVRDADTFQLIDTYPSALIKPTLFEYGNKYQAKTLLPISLPQPFGNSALLRPRSQELQHLLVKTGPKERTEVFMIGEGPTLLLIPAIGLTAPVWFKQLAQYQSRYRLVVIHNPGYGLSDLSGDISVPAVADRFVRTLDALDIREPMHVMGSCFGGVTAQYLAKAYKNRVASLTLVGSFYKNFGLPDVKMDDLTIDQMIEGVKLIGASISNDFDQVLEGSRQVPMVEEARDLLLNSQCVNPLVVMRYITHILTLAGEPWLAEIEAPVLCVAGDRDTIVHPTTSQFIATTVPDGQYHEIAGAGHYPYLTHPDVFDDLVLRFMESASAVKALQNNLA